jgi:cytosine/adenosine deaminase-related metal-dependent hydrolase
MTATQRATRVFCGPGRVLSNAAIHHDSGLITAVTHDEATAHDRRTFVIPALANAHDHGRPTMSSFGAAGMPLETWIVRSVYGMPPDPYLAAAASLAHSARSGCGAMMIH